MATFLLIPGAGGDPWYWSRVVPLLTEQGHQAIAVELPAESPAAGLPEYVEIALAAAGDRPDLVVVGQSLGGFTAPLVCQRRPVRLLVFLNAMIPNPGELPGDWWANTGQADAVRELNLQEGRAPDAPFDPFVFFLHDLPPDLLSEAADHRNDESAAVFSTPCAMTRWPEVPTRVMTAQGDRFFPATFQRRVASERLGITPDPVPGGHLAALSQPRAVADQLLAYLPAR